MSRNFILLVIIGGILLAVIIVLFAALKTEELQLVQTQPEDETLTNNLNPTITFTFNKPIRLTDNFRVVSEPTINAEVYADGQTLFVVPGHTLLENTVYEISTSRIESQDGDILDDIELMFHTGVDQSSQAQFIHSLPVYKDGYTITYLQNSDTFVVEITEQPTQENRTKAINYLRNHDIDTEEENIKFEILRSLEGRGAPPG